MANELISPQDLQFARLVLEQEIATPEQVEEALFVLRRLMEAGARPIPTLGELLVRKGYLAPRQVERTTRMTRCSSTKSRQVVISGVPPEAAKGEPEGKYLKARLLGAGGMGEVWKAWDTELGRWVALKFLKSGEGEERERFRREAHLSAKVSHPNIAAVFEATDRYIAMEFVDGESLATFPRTEVRVLVELVRDAARAVHAAHERGIVHRDLKPHNLMVSRKAGQARLFVTDFGLAKSTHLDRALSVSGMVIGTPSYMAPEQARGDVERIGVRSDVYGLGATLYELLAGRPPFQHSNVYELFKRIVEEEVPRPCSIRPGLDRELQAIVLKCLEKDPELRYATARELADDLTRWLKGEAVRAHPSSVWYRARKFASKRKLVLVLGCGTLLLGPALALTIPRWLAEVRERRLQEERAKREREERLRNELYLNVEAQLNDLRMRFYLSNYRMSEADFQRYDALEGSVREQMKRSGDRAEGWYLIGRCREVKADFEGADAAYGRAMSLEANHAPTLLARGRMGLEQAWLTISFISPNEVDLLEEARGRAKVAADWVSRGVELEGSSENMALDLARGYLELMEKWGPTRPDFDYDSASRLARWEGQPYVEEFLLLEGYGKFGDKKIAIMDEVIRRMPSSYVARLWKGIGLLDKLQRPAARDELTKALEINPRLAVAYHARGVAHQGERVSSAAIADFTRAVTIQPRMFQSHSLRGILRYETGEYEGALRDFSRAVEIYPQYVGGFYNRANARLGIGDLDGAIEDYSRAVELNPRYGEAYCGRGRAKARRKDLEGAMADFTKAIEESPSLKRALLERANLKQERGDLDGAIEDLTRVLEQDPKEELALLIRGCARVDKRNFSGAISDFSRAIEVNPRRARAFGYRGYAKSRSGDLDGAILDYSRAIELDPREPDLYFNRGSLRSSKGDFDGAIEDGSKGIELNPRHAIAFTNRGGAKLQKGDVGGALLDFNRALQIDARFPLPYLGRAECRGMMGDVSGAIRDAERALELAPTDWPQRGHAQALLRRWRS